MRLKNFHRRTQTELEAGAQKESFETLLNVILVKQGVNAEWLFAVGLCFDKSA